MMANIAAVILNFKNYNVTIECVKSLLSNEDNCDIVIVDNGSNNESVDVLKNSFYNEKNVYIIASNKNLGYAKGCNLGIDFCHKYLNSDYIAVLNSDLIFYEKNIINNSINSITGLDKIGIINLQLLNPDGSKQIPYGRYNKSYKYVYFHATLHIIKKIILSFFKKNKKNKNLIDNNEYKCVVNGPAYILTPVFFSYYKYIFDKTFLYSEERNIYAYLTKAKLRSYNANEGKTVHLEAQSTIENISRKKAFIELKSVLSSYRLIFKNQKNISKKYNKNKYIYNIIKGK